jgi:hypothetical protein
LQWLTTIYNRTRRAIVIGKRNKEPVLVEELLMAHGFDIIERLKGQAIPRMIKNRLLHFICKVMTLHQCIKLKVALKYIVDSCV